MLVCLSSGQAPRIGCAAGKASKQGAPTACHRPIRRAAVGFITPPLKSAVLRAGIGRPAADALGGEEALRACLDCFARVDL